MEVVVLKAKLPKHVAIVMDGNGRWAEQRGMPRIEGHKAGLQVVKSVVQCSLEKGIDTLSLFAFSSENWMRPQVEVEFLMQLFLSALEQEIQSLHQQAIRLRFIGDRSLLSSELQVQMQQAEELTQMNQKLLLNVAVNYSGKWDILQASKKVAKAYQEQNLSLDDIDEACFSSYLSTKNWKDPDLFIRTSGEHRISNFFLWQLAYTEFYFTSTQWPDFTEKVFTKALDSYATRERRYGQTSEQLREN